MLQLRINDQTLSIDDVDPETTLLQYVRESLQLTGTKEGCASGDCGACTVVVAQLQPAGLLGGRDDSKNLEYFTVNSCITPLAAMHGRQVLTVDAVGSESQPHPVQAAMMENHASQCGYCTPGFVMSLVGHQLQSAETGSDAPDRCEQSLPSESAPRRENLLHAISGNLCRCTGYRSIVDAAAQAARTECARIPVLQIARAELQRLAHSAQPLEPLPGYHRPQSEHQLQQALKTSAPDRKVRLVAGGTDRWLEVTQLFKTFDSVIDVSAVAELRSITRGAGRLQIGAAVTLTELVALFGSKGPLPCNSITKMLHRFASPQIRNRATLGGNIANASPIADWPPVLLALDAELQITDAGGSTRIRRFADFYRGYRQIDLDDAEYLHSVILPEATDWNALYIRKVSKRHEDDISTLLGAFYLGQTDGHLTEVRIAFGGMAAVPVRVAAVESELQNAAIDSLPVEQVTAALAEELEPITDVRASASYRAAVAGELLRAALREITPGGRGSAGLRGLEQVAAT